MSLESNFVKAELQEAVTYGESAMFDSDLVKSEPRDAEMFHTYSINNLNSMDGDGYNKSIGDHRRMKMEDDIDIFYEDLKCEVDNEENLSNYMRDEDLNQDVKPFFSERARQGADMFGTDASTYLNSMNDNKFHGDHGQMEMEDEIDIVYEDLKYGVENGKYFSYNILAQDSTQDVDPLLLDPATQSNLKSLPGGGSFRCDICLKYFAKSNVLRIHLRVHTGEKPFHCNFCPMSFAQSGTLKNHERRHTGERPFRCEICSKSFTRSHVLKIHEMSHTDERPFQCQTCSESFTRSGDLKIHERIHSGGKLFRCTMCPRFFTQSCYLTIHERTHTGEKPFQCEKMSLVSNSVKTEPQDAGMFPTEFINNLNSMDGDVYNKSIGDHRRMKMVDDNDIFYEDLKCEVDNKENLSNYMRGEDLNQDVKPFFSEPARQGADMFGTDTSTYLNSMNDTKFQGDHGQMKMEDEIDIVYEDLKYGIKNEEYFSYNIPAQDSTQDVDPLLLDRETQSNLKSLPGGGSFRCDICLKYFAKSNVLRIHLRVHTGEKPFHCNFCPMSFAQSSTLKNHERRHTGERPFRCKICSKSFTRSHELKIHEMGHTDERPFQCKTCSESFTRSGDLKIHERIHSGEKLFRCTMCPRFFTQSCYLTIHERTHTGEKPFQCEICSKSFTRSGDLISAQCSSFQQYDSHTDKSDLVRGDFQ
nr:zinc finger protein 436-like [Leptinotarsa decemlineata]